VHCHHLPVRMDIFALEIKFDFCNFIIESGRNTIQSSCQTELSFFRFGLILTVKYRVHHFQQLCAKWFSMIGHRLANSIIFGVKTAKLENCRYVDLLKSYRDGNS